MAQELLRDSWLRGQHGRLCAWEQAKALALREASRELHGRTQLAWIAARLEKVGGGHPSGGALHKFFKVVDGDKELFPGKQRGAARGPKPLMTRAKRRCIAQSAMAAKKLRGDEPCVTAVVHACPRSEALGKARTGVAVPQTSFKRNTWSCGRAAPVRAEALGEARAGVAVPPRSSRQNARSRYEVAPELSEALGEVQVGVAVTLTGSKRNARSRDGAVPEPSEALGETQIRVDGTVRNRPRSRDIFEEAPHGTPISWCRPVFYLKL